MFDSTNQTDTKIVTRERRVIELTAMIVDLEGQIKTKKSDIGILDQELEQRQERLSASNEIFKDLHDKYISEERELKAKVWGQKDEHKRLEDAVKDLRNEKLRLEREINVLTASFSRRQIELEAEFGALTAELKSKEEEQREYISSLTRDNFVLNGYVAEQVKQKEAAEQKLATVKQDHKLEHDRYEADIDQQKNILTTLYANAIEARKANNAAQRAANQRLAETEAKVAAELARLSEKEAMVDRKLAQLKHLEELEREQQQNRLRGGNTGRGPLRRPLAA